MEGFLTEAEAGFHRAAADYFRRQAGPGPSNGSPGPADIWRDLTGAPAAAGIGPKAGGGLGTRISICDEASCHDPQLGRALLAWRSADGPFDPLEELACRLGRLAGTADHVAAAGARAAQEQGAFASSLMGCREVQERLAGLVTGADLVRVGAWRLCRLLERGDRERAGREAAGLEARARAFAAGLRAAAGALLGRPWVEANVPDEDLGFAAERKSP
jgi:hypothetical protein